MNQKAAWSIFGAGMAMFLYQFGEILTTHSSWADVRTPAAVGEILRAFGSGCVAIFGAFGVSFRSERTQLQPDETSVSVTTRSKLPVILLALVVGAGAIGLPACALSQKSGAGVIALSPTELQVQKVRAAAIKFAGATETTAKLVQSALTFADGLERSGTIQPAELAALADVSKTFATAATRGLDDFGKIAGEPGLLTTTSTILDELKPVLEKLKTSSNATLRILATGITIASDAMRLFVSTGGNL